MPAQPHISTKIAAELLGVSQETVRKYIRTGRLPAADLGTSPTQPVYRIPASAVDQLLAARPAKVEA